MRALIAALALVALSSGVARQFTSGALADGISAGPSAGRGVRVDVIATDGKGLAVENLKLADFELREDGAPQAIEEAHFFKVDKAGATDDQALPIQSDADERTEAARPNTRLFAFFLDEYHVSAVDAMRTRAALGRFIDDTLGPRDLIVVMRPLESLLTIRLTRDHERLRESLEAFEGRKADYTPRTANERNIIGGTPAHIEQVRAQVTMSALNALAIHLGNLNREARKTLVAVS